MKKLSIFVLVFISYNHTYADQGTTRCDKENILRRFFITCIEPSHEVVTKKSPLKNCHAIQIKNIPNVVITRGNNGITMTGDSSIIDKISLYLGYNGILYLDIAQDYDAESVRVEISNSRLSELVTLGNSTVQIDDYQGDRLTITTRDSSTVKLNTVLLTKLILRSHGHSKFFASGRVIKQQLYMKDNSEYHGDSLISKNALVKLSGASYALVNVTQKLIAYASGKSAIDYTGNPTILKIHASADAKIQKH